ncbi:VanZ family protein [Desulforhopalus vacuolatus]|nr:VanZ family protein [Desulforhopalus vacuolatus]
MGTIFFLSNIPGDQLNLPYFPGMDKIAHGGIYGLLASAVLFALQPRWRRNFPFKAICLTVFFCIFYGITDEFHQSFIPGRSPDIFDVFADSIGAFLCSLFWWRFIWRDIKNR